MTRVRKFLLWSLAVAGLLVVATVSLLWSWYQATHDIGRTLPLAAVEVEGDALSAMLLVRKLARTAGSPDQPDDHRPGEPPPPPEPGIDRLRSQIAAQAPDDWRVLALLADPNPSDPPLPPPGAQERLLAIAGDNAFVHLQRFAREARCCAGTPSAEAATAAMQATRYEGFATAAIASLDDRYGRVPASQFSPLLPDAVFRPMASGQALIEGLFLMSQQSDSDYDEACENAGGQLREACLHLAMLVVRDAAWMHEANTAGGVVEALGNPEQRATAKARNLETDWLAWHVNQSMREDQKLAYDPRFQLAPFGHIEAMRGMLREAGIAPTPPPGWTRPSATD